MNSEIAYEPLRQKLGKQTLAHCRDERSREDESLGGGGRAVCSKTGGEINVNIQYLFILFYFFGCIGS